MEGTPGEIGKAKEVQQAYLAKSPALYVTRSVPNQRLHMENCLASVSRGLLEGNPIISTPKRWRLIACVYRKLHPS
jgi:hypothetical protein